MLKIKKFIFNPFDINTYLVIDDSKECAIIDPGCSDDEEREELTAFIRDNGLRPVHLLNTHSHIDHIAGNHFVSEKYGLPLRASFKGIRFTEHSKEGAAVFGFEHITFIPPEKDLAEGDVIPLGPSKLEVAETPGHADGSVCFISHDDKFVISGDVLFYQSIGRTDLPSGDYDLLISSIREKLFTLGKDYKVYPGHGPATTIGFEMTGNPFLAEPGY